MIDVDIIKAYMKKHSISRSEFCKQCKISVFVLNKLLCGKTNIRIAAIFKIAKVMGVKVSVLFRH